MIIKERPALIKAVGEDDGLQPGQFSALVAVFNNVDSYGDVVMPGAFADSLENDYRATGDPLPCIWSHQWSDPFAHIGFSNEYSETEAGLVVVSSLDIAENPTAAQAYKLMKQRRVKQFSFGFDVLDGAWGTRKNSEGHEYEVYELRKLKLYEVGPCLLGVNQSTELLGIKGDPPSKASGSHRRDSEDAHRSAEQKTRPVDQLGAWANLQEVITSGDTP